MSKDGLTIYPNPVTAGTQVQLSLQSSNAAQSQMQVLGIDGKIYIQARDTVYELNRILNNKLSAFARGVYLVKLNNITGSYTAKFIKQ